MSWVISFSYLAALTRRKYDSPPILSRNSEKILDGRTERNHAMADRGTGVVVRPVGEDVDSEAEIDPRSVAIVAPDEKSDVRDARLAAHIKARFGIALDEPEVELKDPAVFV